MQKKKVLAILLAVVMVLGLCSMASATAPADRVQINNMMVDASMVDPAMFDVNEETAEDVSAQAQSDSIAVQSNLAPSDYFPPIKNINIDIPNYEENGKITVQQTQILYTLTLPIGTTEETLAGKTIDFTFGGDTTSSPVNGDIILKYKNIEYKTAPGGTVQVPMEVPLDGGFSEKFTITWNTTLNNVAQTVTRTCYVNFTIPTAVESVEVTKLTVAGEGADLKTPSVGGVTRYLWTAGLENTSSLSNVTVRVTLQSAMASATLGGVSGSPVGKNVTFSNVDLTTSKELVVTCGTLSRTYQVSAYIKGNTVTVHIAIRSFLADEYLENRTNWYAGYGTSAVTDEAEKTRLLGVASYLRSANSPTTDTETKYYNGNGPLIQEASGRMIFREESYVTLNVPSSYTVRDALNSFTSNTTYFPNGFVITGSDSYIEAMGQTASSVMGEFSCGSASGWMYTARTSRTDVTTALPNAGANTWSVSDGMYIDWYYTADYGADFGYSMFG